MTEDQTSQQDPSGDERPSRSEQKRAAQSVLDLASRLVAMTPAQLDKAGLPDEIRAEVDNVRSIKSHVARKRQLGFLAKLMRRSDDEDLDSARAQLGENREQHLRDTAEQHRVEALRQRLIDDDDALTELLEQHDDLDRQHLRSLIRQARRERDTNKPPHASRQLFRLLKKLPPS
ncbi:MAG: ribosome biogenesis factor YjgA [Rhodanobacteraceae bacterium]